MKRYGISTPNRAGTGVRGSVEYRRASDQYVKSKNCPKGLLVAVNILLVLLAALLLLAAVWVFTPLSDVLAFGKAEREITLQFEFIDADGALAPPALVGTAMFDAARSTVIGEIIAIESKPLEREAYLAEGGATLLPDDAVTETLTYPVQIVIVTVRAPVEYRADEGYYTALGERLYVGGRYAVSLGSSIAAGDCTALEEVSE